LADLVALKFDTTYGAQAALAAVRALTELNYAWVDDVAVVEKHKSGRVATHTPHGSVAGGALFGALIGMLLFWWFPPLWFLGGWIGGAGVGALVGKAMKESGVDEKMIDEVKGELTNDSSMLLLIGATGDADQMSRAFEPYKPVKVIRHALPDKTVDNLKQAFEENPPPPAPADPS
jgi:uncharacterized membrane protein